MPDTWDHMTNWDLVLPPSRPTEAQLGHIRSLVAHIDRSAPIAVLGSTPEFRDLLFECGCSDVFILERNVGFYESMSRSRIYRSQETLVRGDWLETLPNCTDMFTLILSDLTSGNITYEARAHFYRAIEGALRPGGLFCDKVLTHPGPNLRVDDLITKYSNLPLNLLTINHFNCEMIFCSELLDLGEVVDTTAFYSIIEERAPNERIRTFARRTAEWITPSGCTWWYGKKWDKLEPSYCPHLVRVSVADDHYGSPYFGRLKLYTLAKQG